MVEAGFCCPDTQISIGLGCLNGDSFPVCSTSVDSWLGRSASATLSCDQFEHAYLSLTVSASNWSNLITTRTPEGGPYKYKRVICDKFCNIVEELTTVLKYEPGHPDADAEGNVSYPDINQRSEFIAMSAYAQILRQVGNRCSEKSSVIDNVTSAKIDYRSGNVRSDIFNFDANTNLISWVRESSSGQQIINF